ncbi:MAG TPA: sugar phosphate isomerase/epimerase [Candidatus Nanoarchaeia archaeon]|nr:sugar phosphate isomerase/epimerase [Candidatus Nanoarchaeia archaeon]
MRISCSSLFLWDFSVEEIVEILTIAGIENMEFWAETPEFWRHRHEPEAMYKLKDTISVFSDQCTVHAPIMDLNASSYNEHVCNATIIETKWAIDLTAKLDSSILTIHPGKRTVNRAPTPEDWDRFLDYLTVCIDHASEMDVTLALENPTPSVRSMCYDPVQMANVIATFPDLMMTFDIPHALQIDVDNAMKFIDDLGDRIINIHVGGIHNGVPHYPGYLGQNQMTTDVLSRLKLNGYKNDLTIEIDDKLLDGYQSKSDKISILENERAYLIRAFSSA